MKEVPLIDLEGFLSSEVLGVRRNIVVLVKEVR